MQKTKNRAISGENAIECGLCHNGCIIPDGSTGACGARKNISGKLTSLVYGYPVLAIAEPIEKKPFFHFAPGTLAYSIGTYGCNLSCHSCPNWKNSKIEDLQAAVKGSDFFPSDRIVENAIDEDCHSVAFDCNEPTVYAEYARDIMEFAHENGIKNLWVTNGYMTEGCLLKILPYLDAVCVELKSLNAKLLKNLCGSEPGHIARNLLRFKNEQVHLEITTTVIPSINDNFGDLGKISEFIANELGTDTPWHIRKFLPENSWKLQNLEKTGDDILYEAFDIGKNNGLKYVYAGSMPGDQKENTYCPKCGELAIHRTGYSVERYDIKGRCQNCDKNLDILN